MFFVSGSPWNLYDLLSDFFRLQNFSQGSVLFLRDWGLSENEFAPSGHRSFKLGIIQRLLDMYTDLPFILIGDNGQEDPKIYAEVAFFYPGRILAIYIRNVSHDHQRAAAVRALAEEVAGVGSEMILAEDTLHMAEHTAERGWIAADEMAKVRVEG